MFHGTMTTLVAMPLVAELPVESFAVTSLTEVVTDSPSANRRCDPTDHSPERVRTQEPDKRVELSHTVL